MKKTTISTIVSVLLGLISLYPTLAAAQLSNISNAGDTVVGPLPDETKVLSAEEAKKLDSQAVGSQGGSHVVQPSGIYREIDTTKSMRLMKELRGPPSLESTNDIADIKRRPGDYIPPVLMSMAVAEFNNGDVADAEFWLHAGLLRSVLDVKLCSDLSMRDTPRVLLLQMPVALRRAALADPIEKAKVAREVAAWDETTPMSYDHRWTALHGIQATMSAMEPEHALTVLTVPQSQWAEAAKNNRTEYLTQMSNGSAPKPTR